jgi:hypothetical protein
MLKGKAKRDYMREWMRRKRAGLPTTTPKSKPKSDRPRQRVIDQIAYWARNPSRQSTLAIKVLDGLVLDNDASWLEACRRHKVLSEERRAERDRAKLKATKPRPRECSFCGEPAAADRLLIGDRFPLICETCVAEAAVAIAKHRATIAP